jgi:hypothetical protein
MDKKMMSISTEPDSDEEIIEDDDDTNEII